MSEVAELEEKDLIEIEYEIEQTQLPTYLFEEAEEELTKLLISEAGEIREEETDALST